MMGYVSTKNIFIIVTIAEKLTGTDLQHVSAPRLQTEGSETEHRGGNSCEDGKKEKDDWRLIESDRETKCVSDFPQ